MKEFNEWWEIRNRDRHDYNLPESLDSCDKKLAEKAYQAGMLAAADVAERMYFTHTPDDGVISGEGVADEIRKRANDI